MLLSIIMGVKKHKHFHHPHLMAFLSPIYIDSESPKSELLKS